MKRLGDIFKKAALLLLCITLISGSFGMIPAFAAENEYSYDSRYAGFLGQGLKHDARFKKYKKRYGIDVSAHQKNVDWKVVADAGTEFAFIRVGYRGYESGIPTEDSYAASYIKSALYHGLKVGVYFYSQAITVEEGIEEAEFVAAFLERYGFSPACIRLPVVYDVEYPSKDGSYVGRLYEANLSIPVRTEIAIAFMERIKLHGYDAMFYGSRSALNSQSKARMSEINGKYPVWLAAYTRNKEAGYEGPYTFWQYSCFGKVPGIDVQTDLDVWYDDGVRAKTGWIEKKDGMHYVDPESGKELTGMQTILGRDYCFDETGKMLTGWHIIENKRYCFTQGGLKRSGEEVVNGIHFSFSPEGALKGFWYFAKGKLYTYKAGLPTLTAGGMPEITKKK